MCEISQALYKYRAISNNDRTGLGGSYTRNLLVNGELYFPRFSELDDPNEALFDYHVDVPIFIREEDLDDPLYRNFTKTREKVGDRIKIVVDGRACALHVRRNLDPMYGVLCLTEDPKSSLMFDYYAAGHKGICIGFNWSKFRLRHKNSNELQLLKQVSYRSTPPLVNPHDPNNFEEVLFSKWKKYRHEKERRLIYKPGIFPNKDNVLGAIDQIIFGLATSKDDRDLVFQWVTGLKITFYEAYLKPKNYNLFIRKI